MLRSGAIYCVRVSFDENYAPSALVGELSGYAWPSNGATIAFYGEAPGIVSGVMQVNVVIPTSFPLGTITNPLPLTISIGGEYSQLVAIAVK
jgi:hypothetical protein